MCAVYRLREWFLVICLLLSLQSDGFVEVVACSERVCGMQLRSRHLHGDSSIPVDVTHKHARGFSVRVQRKKANTMNKRNMH